MTLAEVKDMLEAWRDWDSQSDDPPPGQSLDILSALLAITDRLLLIDG